MPGAARGPVSEPKLRSLSEDEVRAALQLANPDAPVEDVQTMAKIIAVVSDLLTELPHARRRKLLAGKGELREVLIHATRDVRRSAKRSHGEFNNGEAIIAPGPGRRIIEQGRAHRARSAVAKSFESWAGPVAGVGQIEFELGIPRSTLSRWHQRRVIIGLLRGERKLTYPLEQFVDGRPIPGISEVLMAASDARSAWLWLRKEHAELDGRTPLETLKTTGGRQRVAEVASRDFV